MPCRAGHAAAYPASSASSLCIPASRAAFRQGAAVTLRDGGAIDRVADALVVNIPGRAVEASRVALHAPERNAQE